MRGYLNEEHHTMSDETRFSPDTGSRLSTFFAVVFLTSAAGLGGWFISEESHRRDVPIVEHERHYIYGFGKRGSNRPFGDYLEEVTAEGLREIRWDHRHSGDPRFAGISSGSGAIYPASTSNFVVYSTSASTGSAVACIQPTVWTTTYLR
jgi:hypothetical protein